MTDSKFSLPLETEQIMELLPHRYPFLMLDRVVEYTTEPEPRVTALKNVSINEPHFQGHFPDHAVMPGVLIIEAMAQAAGILVHLGESGRNNPGAIFYLVKVDNARFSKPVVPGDQLQLQVTQKRILRGMAQYRCLASVNGSKVASADMICAAGKA